MVKNLKKKVTQQIKLLVSLALILLTIQKLAAQEATETNTIATTQHPFVDFSAEFAAFRYGRELGNATIALSKVSEKQYRLDYSSSLSIFFLSDKRKETSYFSIENQQIIPHNYIYIRTGTGSDKHVNVVFDHDKNKILVNDRPSFPLEDQFDNQLYRLDIQAKLAAGQSDFNYKIINYRGELREYQFKVLNNEKLSLPFGEIETIKVAMLRENSTRQTYVWFAPALNYQLVRLQQFKDGEEQGDIQLRQFTLKPS